MNKKISHSLFWSLIIVGSILISIVIGFFIAKSYNPNPPVPKRNLK